MKDGMTIIDADGHVLDWEAVYRQRLPEAFKKREKIMGADDAFDRTQNGGIVRRGETVEMQLADNETQGIDVQVILSDRRPDPFANPGARLRGCLRRDLQRFPA